MLRVSNGALQAVVSVETHECLTLLRPPQSGARPDVLECDDEIIALLRAMAYVEQKEVCTRRCRMHTKCGLLAAQSRCVASVAPL